MKRPKIGTKPAFQLISSILFLNIFLAAGDFALNREGHREIVIAVPGNMSWTDTGVDVEQDQEVSFNAHGKISLQKGNPQADCGPDGTDLRTVQQPLRERNMGALIGKVVISVTVTVDEKTGEEKKEENAEIFYIGADNRLAMPAKGRLFLGINENVIADNVGEFKVTVLF